MDRLAMPARPDPALELEQLRSLLLEPETLGVEEIRTSLLRLRQQLDDPDEFITILAPLIDEAIRRRTHADRSAMVAALAPLSAAAIHAHYHRQPEEVSHDLAPVIGSSIREQIRSQRNEMVDSLYPIIGTTIAKYMSEAIRDLMRSINEKIERTVTVRGIMLRMKARALGVSEAELLLRESMPYKIQAVFLIRKESGILLAQARNRMAKQFDPDMVSGMLTAIRSFVNEWIARSGEVSEIDQIEYGRSKILLEVAGSCYLATVVEGEPPKEFYAAMRGALARIVQDHAKAIEQFTGDQASLDPGIGRELDRLAGFRTQTQEHRATPSLKPLVVTAGILGLLLLAFFGYRWYTANADRQTEATVEQALAAFPPLRGEPVGITAEGENIRLSGTVANNFLRGKAESVAQTAIPSGTIMNALTVQEPPPFTALTGMEADRIASALNSVQGITLASEMRDHELVVTGFVNRPDLEEKIIRSFAALRGVDAITSRLKVTDPLHDTRIRFDLGSSTISPAEQQRLQTLKEYLMIRHDERLRLIGHSDLGGSRATNLALASQRASAVRNALVALGVDPSRLQAERSDKPAPGLSLDSPANRCVHFEQITTSR